MDNLVEPHGGHLVDLMTGEELIGDPEIALNRGSPRGDACPARRPRFRRSSIGQFAENMMITLDSEHLSSYDVTTIVAQNPRTAAI